MKLIKIIFLLVFFYASYGQAQLLNEDFDWRMELGEIPEAPEEVTKKFPKAGRCLSGPFQDQGYWFSCEADEPYDTTTDLSSTRWVIAQRCSHEGQNVSLILDKRIPLAGLKNCQLLILNPLENAEENEQDFLTIIDRQGQEIWSYSNPILMEKLLGWYQEGAEILYQDMIVFYDNDYIFWDGQDLLRANQQRQIIWRKNISSLLQEEEADGYIINRSAGHRLKIVTTATGKIYLFMSLERREPSYAQKFVMWEMNPSNGERFSSFPLQDFTWNDSQLRNIELLSSTEEIYYEYEPIFLGDDILAIFWSIPGAMGLSYFDAVNKKWQPIWKNTRHGDGSILYVLKKENENFILLEDSLQTIYEGQDGTISLQDRAIRLIKLDKSGSLIKNKRFLLEEEGPIGESNYGPLGYLTASNQNEINLIITPNVVFSHDWWHFTIKPVDE